MPSSPRKTRLSVLIAVEQAVVRAGMRLLIGEQNDLEAHECPGAATALRAVERVQPDVVLLDYESPGCRQEAVLRALAETGGRVVVNAGGDQPELMLAALRAGARGAAPHSASGRVLLEAVRAVGRGLRWLTPDLERYCTEHRIGSSESAPEPENAHWARLTCREKQVARLVGQGLRQQDIADRLGISIHTVKNHLRRVFMKLDVTNRVELALFERSRERSGTG